MSALDVTWPGGAGARIVKLEDDRVSLLTARAFAPGSRPEGTLADATAVRVKTARCRRATEEERAGVVLSGGPDPGVVYLLEGRLLDASRALRDRITSDLRAATASDPEPTP